MRESVVASKHRFFESTEGSNKSLDEVNGSIKVPKDAGFLRTLMAYTGPGILIAVGYMDPGNWIT
ncbi:MAG: divalent metal cation transporter, partial [Lentilactobacillus hilgardii]